MVRQVFLVAGLSLIAVTGSAQTPFGGGAPGTAPVVQPAVSPSVASDSLADAPVGPAIQNVSVAFRPAGTAAATAMPLQTARQRRSVTLMIIGGGMLLGGLIIGDDAGTVIAVGGLVVGLIGLYQYLQ